MKLPLLTYICRSQRPSSVGVMTALQVDEEEEVICGLGGMVQRISNLRFNYSNYLFICLFLLSLLSSSTILIIVYKMLFFGCHNSFGFGIVWRIVLWQSAKSPLSHDPYVAACSRCLKMFTCAAIINSGKWRLYVSTKWRIATVQTCHLQQSWWIRRYIGQARPSMLLAILSFLNA